MPSRKLRVLMVITPSRYSGAERMVLWQSQGLMELGHEVHVLCKPNAGLEADLRTAGVPVQSAPISGKANLLAPLLIARVARRLGADVIHTHLSTASLWGSIAGKLASIPVVAEVHALNSKTCFLLADRIVSCSEGVKQHLVAQGVPARRVEVLLNGLPPSRLEHLRPVEEVRDELGLEPGQPAVGVVAHLSPKKGQRHLIEAMAAVRRVVPNAVCLCLGEGPDRERLQSLARNLGLTDAVRFLGFRDDAVSVMQALDVVVLPSVAKEGLGLALVEAAFLGIPGVGSDCPGIDEVIAHGQTGLLAPPGDSTALADAILRLLSDAPLRAAWGRAARVRAQKLFTQAAMATRAEAIYLDMLRPPHR